jgi:hypothetical protein
VGTGVLAATDVEMSPAPRLLIPPADEVVDSGSGVPIGLMTVGVAVAVGGGSEPQADINRASNMKISTRTCF